MCNLATGNDAPSGVGYRHLEGWHHQGEALRDAGGDPHGIVEHGAYETALYDAGHVGELSPGHECYLRPRARLVTTRYAVSHASPLITGGGGREDRTRPTREGQNKVRSSLRG